MREIVFFFFSGEFENDDCLQSYQQLKMRYKAAGKDFEILTRIANLVFTLSDEYQVTINHVYLAFYIIVMTFDV